MDDILRTLLSELETFGSTNDARATTRHEKMLNITRQTGEFLALLVQAAKARRVLEIGTSNGYSTLWLADAVKAISGHIITVEVLQPKAEMARRNLQRSGLSHWVRQELTEAGRFLEQQPDLSFDLLFLDADREQYLAWWPAIQKLLAPGGLLVVDNAISHAAEMHRFISEVRDTPTWRSLVVPIGNGEFVALKPFY
jgi:predicted O-methyltransferase YrrM